MSQSNVTTPVAENDSRPRFAAAFERRADEIAAVTDDQFIPINVDINQAVMTVLGTLPEIAKLRPGIAKLDGVDQHAVDSLEDFAMATGEASLRYAIALSPQDDILGLNDEALRLRELLRSDASALARRGTVDPARVQVFKGAPGYKNVAFELMGLANLLMEAWPEIQGKTGCTEEELRHAKDVGEQLAQAVGVREQAPVIASEAARARQQAFTLMVTAYDEVRRALSFLRWHENDADTIAPSLYGGRVRSKPQTDTPADGAPPAGTSAAVTSPAVAPAVSPAPSAPAAATAAKAANPPIPPGMPGASPFIR